jgi:radical SAM superfamily enzyme YgiQ (UPF0313 family)
VIREQTLFRPPSEAESLIIRVADGCPHNGCTFCGMYKGVRYRPHEPEEAARAIDGAARAWPDATRVFLADGDVMALPYERLRDLLERLGLRLPRLARVNVYANGRSILEQTPEQLRALRALKLQTLYMGLESGDPETLTRVHKRDRVEEMIAAAQRAQACGLRMSVMILVGLGGRERSREHGRATAEALNRMQPPFLAALRYIPVAGTPLAEEIRRGGFTPLSEREATVEMREILAGLELAGTLFRANHVSNVVPLGGRFPRDRERLLAELDHLLAANVLDAAGPGPLPLWL